ncbi:MAG: hypothetical protein HWE08_13535 [Alphaproteobacteria bacterium]|nr:hypothetical protein [Alphaproteobacteria bacterium]
MQDLFTKICLGVIALSLAAIAFVQVANHAAPSQAKPAPQASNQNTDCDRTIAEHEAQLAVLQDQIKNVPQFIEDARAESTDAKAPNRLYEQLMQEIIKTRTKLEDLKERCAS